jgi:hypothetical protein
VAPSIRNGDLFERWKARRAEAELARLRYFEIVTRERELSEPLLQLEYFRRYQLDVQRAYYRKRGRDHEREAGRALRLGSVAMAAGGIATGVAGALAVSLGPAWGSLAILALVAQAVGVRAGSQEATAQYRRNAERHHRTRTVLLELYGRLDAVRAAVAGGEPAAIRELVAAVHEQLALEHREWVAEMETAGEAVHRLEELLERHREGPGEVPAGAGRFFGVGAAVLPPVRLPAGAHSAGASGHPDGEE